MNDAEFYRILLVEDNELDARVITKELESHGDCIVERVADLAAGIAAVQSDGYDCVLLDLSLPDSDGLVSVDSMVARSPHCPVIVLTGLDDPAVAIEAVERGAQDYLVKNTLTGDVGCRSIRYAVARHHTETELRSTQERLMAMHAREQIAQDLHDTVIQRLFAAGMTLQAASCLADRDAIVERALSTVDEIDAAIRELRQAIFGLHMLDEHESLASEIEELAGSYRAALGFDPVIRIGDLPELSVELRRDVVAVVAEALSNVSRHAKATTATVTITGKAGEVSVRVVDNGRGFGNENLSSSAAHDHGNGLKNMAARARAHEGSMRIGAGSPGGTEVCWTVTN